MMKYEVSTAKDKHELLFHQDKEQSEDFIKIRNKENTPVS